MVLDLQRMRPTELLTRSDSAPRAQSGEGSTRARRFRLSVPDGWRTNRWRFILAAVAFAAVIVTNLIDLRVHHLSHGLLNANWRFSWSHDVDTLAFAAGVVICARAARGASPERRLWSAIATLLGVLFLIEASPLHTQVDLLLVDGLSVGKLFYTPILLALLVCMWRLVAHTDQRGGILVGLATLFLSFGMHVIGLGLLRPLGYLNAIYQGGVGAKEGLELAGLFLLIPGLWVLARRVPARDARR